MAYTYHGRSGLIKTGEVTTMLPCGLLQKKVTVVKRIGESGNSSATEPLRESQSKEQLGEGFFAFPAISTATDLYNGFVQYDIVGYAKGSGSINSVINYKYRKLSSFIVEDQFRPRTFNISVEVGVRSTVVLTAGTQTTTENENGDSVTTTTYEEPLQYQGKLLAYGEFGAIFIDKLTTEISRQETETVIVVITENCRYSPVLFVESVSSNYYGHFTEYISTTSQKIQRNVLSRTITEQLKD